MAEGTNMPEPDDVLGSSVRQFIQATAAKNPTPGGGSVAATGGALAAALAEMALQYTVGKKQFEAHRGELTEAIEKLRKAAGLMQELVSEDMAAYAFLSGFMKMPAAEREGRADYLTAVAGAIRAPQRVGGLALHILELTDGLLDKTNPYLISDLGVAAAYAHATVHAAEFNVLVNLKLLTDEAEREASRKKAEDLSLSADIVYHKVRMHMKAVL